MSSQITTAFVNQFKQGIFLGVQQKGSRLRNYVRNEMQQSVLAFYDGLNATVANSLTARAADTSYVNSIHVRRACPMQDFVWADLIDNADKLRILNDPTNYYSENAINALGRSIDDVIIKAAMGNSASTVDGSVNVVLPATQFVGAADGSSLTNLNVRTLRLVKSKFGINDVDDSERLYICVDQRQIDNLLSETAVTSSDFNTIKALVQGEIDTFMGFKFIRSQRLPKNNGDGFVATITASTGAVALSTGNGDALRRAFAWAPSGIVLGMGQDMEAKIEQLPTKNYSTQVYARMSLGAVRLQEEKVVGIICTE